MEGDAALRLLTDSTRWSQQIDSVTYTHAVGFSQRFEKEGPVGRRGGEQGQLEVLSAGHGPVRRISE